MMQQLTPLLKTLGFAKSHGMVFQCFPSGEQKISIRCFDTSADLKLAKAWASFDERAGNAHSVLEGCFLPYTHVENCDFQNHGAFKKFTGESAPGRYHEESSWGQASSSLNRRGGSRAASSVFCSFDVQCPA